MTQEDKELLKIDMSARIPYHLKVEVKTNIPFINTIRGIDIDGCCEINDDFYDIDKIKPYLFPFDSINEEQYEEFLKTCNGYCEYYWTEETFDWLNKNKIDYRDLIPKKLAIDATNTNVYINPLRGDY